MIPNLSVRKLSPIQWLNFAWMALVIIFVFQIGLTVIQRKIPPLWFSDFASYYATSQIILSRGVSHIYDIQLQSQFQQILHNESLFGLQQVAYVTAPMPYLPAFALVFTPLSFFPYFTAYGIWIVINILLYLFYLWRFTRALGAENGRDLLFPLSISIPVISTFVLGQVNVFLVIFFGEFILASLKGEDTRSGLWLSGLLLKPQLLILVLPGLLIKKKYKTLASFTVAAGGILVLSLILVGLNGLERYGLLILGFAHGLPSNSPEVMMNWRALGLNLEMVLPGYIPWIIVLEGMVFTIWTVLSLWKLPVENTSAHYGLLLLATLAGTLTVSWHSHNPMNIINIPLIIFLYARKILPWKMLSIWLLVPAAYLILMLFISPSYARAWLGLTNLAVNLVILGWSARSLYKVSRPV